MEYIKVAWDKGVLRTWSLTVGRTDKMGECEDTNGLKRQGTRVSS